MNETLELISETQNKLKELLDNYKNERQLIQKENEDRIEELYGQILGFIAEKFEPYREFYVRYCNKVHTVASVWIQGLNSGGEWVDIRANSDWTQFFFDKGYYGLEVSHRRIVLGWQRIKEDFLKRLEKHKADYLRIGEISMNENLKLKEQLDAFEL